jgi:large subunit ribosomal protein L1
MAEAKKATTKKKDSQVEKPAAEEKDVTAAAVDAAEQEQAVIEEKRSPEPAEATAKAGKRSSKALKEAAEKQAKEERKAGGEEAGDKPKAAAAPARSRLERRSKGFRKSAEQIEPGKNYELKQALELARNTSHVKFDATVEMHIRLGVDPRQADQNIRDSLVLPAGSGKTVNVAVLNDEVFAALDKGAINFDVLVATPEQMPKLTKYARLLGPRGLMPNPKSGTVTTDVDKAVNEAKGGRVEYRVDSTGIVHLGIGKASFAADQLGQNANAVLASIKANKPSGIKGNYFRSVYLTTSMGPSISVDLASIS